MYIKIKQKYEHVDLKATHSTVFQALMNCFVINCFFACIPKLSKRELSMPILHAK